MFNKLKQLQDLKSQAKTMQTALSGEKVSGEKRGVTITMDGNMEVLSLTINASLNKTEQEAALKDCFNDTLKKAQRLMAKKLQDMGGLPGLR
jgi:DNA-binding protein YbaB